MHDSRAKEGPQATGGDLGRHSRPPVSVCRALPRGGHGNPLGQLWKGGHWDVLWSPHPELQRPTVPVASSIVLMRVRRDASILVGRWVERRDGARGGTGDLTRRGGGPAT